MKDKIVNFFKKWEPVLNGLALIMLGFGLGVIFFASYGSKFKHNEESMCSNFWNEKCVLVYVPESITSNFSEEYYKTVKDGQKTLIEENK